MKTVDFHFEFSSIQSSTEFVPFYLVPNSVIEVFYDSHVRIYTNLKCLVQEFLI